MREEVATTLFWTLVGIVVVSGIVTWVVLGRGGSEEEPTFEIPDFEATVIAGLKPEDLDSVISSCSEAQEIILLKGKPRVPGRYIREAEDYYVAHC